MVRDTRGWGLSRLGDQEVYLPLAEQQLSSRPILIRTQAEPKQVRGLLGPLLTSIDPTISATADTLEERLWASPLFGVSMLFGAFSSAVGICALLLALMGIYGTVSYIVVLRTREIGIRRAIGAQKGDVLRLILRESTRISPTCLLSDCCAMSVTKAPPVGALSYFLYWEFEEMTLSEWF